VFAFYLGNLSDLQKANYALYFSFTWIGHLGRFLGGSEAGGALDIAKKKIFPIMYRQNSD